MPGAFQSGLHAKGRTLFVPGPSRGTVASLQSVVFKKNFNALAIKCPKLKFVIAEYSPKKREAHDIVFGIPNERRLGAFIWEPTRYQEAAFTRSGNHYTVDDALMDLYPAMSKAYGNEALPLNPSRAHPIVH